MSNQVFNVSNMKCGGCVESVIKAINALPDTEAVEVSLEDKKAIVNSDQPASVIAEAISDAGFPAEPG